MALDRNEILAVIGTVGMGFSHLVYDNPALFGFSALMALPLVISNLVWGFKKLLRQGNGAKRDV